jgi:hypothetical protein
MCALLPNHPNLHDMKKEARKLLHALKQRDAAALRRYHTLQAWERMPEPRLDDAQYVIARERGFSSWKKLSDHLASVSRSNC